MNIIIDNTNLTLSYTYQNHITEVKFKTPDQQIAGSFLVHTEALAKLGLVQIVTILLKNNQHTPRLQSLLTALGEQHD